jgi:hypothetical protein
MKYTYPFDFPIDYNLLLEDSLALSEYQTRHARTGLGHGYRPAKEGDEITHYACKLHILSDDRITDNPYKMSIESQCKRLMDAIGCKDYDVILVEYDSESFLNWHIDKDHSSPDVFQEYGRINIIVTENWEDTPIIFKDDNGQEVPCPGRLQAVNTYRIEHRYDNRGKENRLLLIMTTKDMNYDEVINAIKRISF